MKRKLKWTAVLLVVLLPVLGAVLFLLPRDRITLANYERIRDEMTMDDVERLLGGPGMNEKEFLAQHGKDIYRLKARTAGESRFWLGRRYWMEIRFAPQGYVSTKCYSKLFSAEPTLLERLRDWIGW